MARRSPRRRSGGSSPATGGSGSSSSTGISPAARTPPRPRRYLPDLTAADLLPAPAGIRAQALARDGSLVDDFLFAESARVVHVQNAPSPAATSSLAIGERIADRALELFAKS